MALLSLLPSKVFADDSTYVHNGVEYSIDYVKGTATALRAADLIPGNYGGVVTIEDFLNPGKVLSPSGGVIIRHLQIRVTAIADYAFAMNQLSSVTFKTDSLLTIGKEAFFLNFFTSITIPASVKTIGGGAFDKCDGLKEIKLVGTVPPTLENGLPLSSNVKIKVPSGSVIDYRKANGWNAYSRNITADFEHSLDIEDDCNNGLTSDMWLTYEAGSITYHRSFGQNGQYATMCLPFYVDVDQYEKVFEHVYYPIGAVRHENGLYKLRFKEWAKGRRLDPWHPYFFKLKDEVREVFFYNSDEWKLSKNLLDVLNGPFAIDVWRCSPKDEKTGEVIDNVTIQFCSNFVKSNEECYTFNADGTFGLTDGNDPYRMSITITDTEGKAAPKCLSVGFDGGGTTGINGVKGADTSAKASGIYTLSGVLVSSNGSTQGLAKGIYVKDGKKIVVK